jgi:hypothetical protein
LNKSLSHEGRPFQEKEPRREPLFAEPPHRTGIVLLVLFLLVISTGKASAQSMHLEGTYDVYDWGGPVDRPWTSITIFNQNADGFSIKGEGWAGHGTLQWMSGYYDWTAPDGKTHRTTFVVRADGTIYGSVRDQQNPKRQYNWDYTAKLQVKGAAKSSAECDAVRDKDLPACKTKPTPGDQFVCTDEVLVRWTRCLETCGR